MAAKRISTTRPQYIEVNGLIGEFHGLGNAKNYVVKYFSTKANQSTGEGVGHGLSLLEELKPMRERVETTKMPDLQALLQRDLNDFRIAEQLIPYLLGKDNEISFFPSVLVVMVPKGFLNAEDVQYPRPSIENEFRKYGDCWILEEFLDEDNNPISLGKIKIDPRKTDLIVIDGQHRANAFRFLSKNSEMNESSSVYNPIYKNISIPTDPFKSELPVTLIWFENNNTSIDPLMISRKLFIDVNSNAQEINESRIVLLKDNDIPCIVTNEFYSLLAKRGFSADSLSLLHAGFDVNSAKEIPSICLFYPELIRDCFLNLLLGSDGFDNINKLPQRDTTNRMNNLSRLKRFILNFQDPEDVRIRSGVAESIKNFRNSLKSPIHSGQSVTECFLKIFEAFPFVKYFIQFTNQLEKNILEKDTILIKVWKEIFKGGEGLYQTYAELRNQQIDYLAYIDKIDSNFNEILKNGCEDSIQNISIARKTLFSKASLIGYFSAFGYLVYKLSFDKAYDAFIPIFQNISLKTIMNIAKFLKPMVIGPNMDPKSWPLFRSIYLSVFFQNGEVNEENQRINPYRQLDKDTFSMDYFATLYFVNEKISAWTRNNENLNLTLNQEEVLIWKNDFFTQWKTTLKECSLKCLFNQQDFDNLIDVLISENNELKRYYANP